MRRGLLLPALMSAMAVLACACGPTTSSAPPATAPQLQGISVWALSDSQGSESTDPARGLPWTERLGSNVGNGAQPMQGAGWTVNGTFTGVTVPAWANQLATRNNITKFVVMAGINDLSAGKTVNQMLSGVIELEQFAAAMHITVTWVGIVPVPQGATIANRNSDRLAFNQVLAARYGSRYVDCSSTMATSSGWLKPTLSLAPDNLHLNSAGEQALASCVSGRF